MEVDRVLVLYMTVVETVHKRMYSTHFTTLTMYYLNTEGIEISNLRRIMVGQKYQMLPSLCCSREGKGEVVFNLNPKQGGRKCSKSHGKN